MVYKNTKKKANRGSFFFLSFLALSSFFKNEDDTSRTIVFSMSQPSPVFGWLALRWACGDKPNRIQGKSFSNLSSLPYLFFQEKNHEPSNTHAYKTQTLLKVKKKKENSRSQLENVQVMKNAVKVLEDNDTRLRVNIFVFFSFPFPPQLEFIGHLHIWREKTKCVQL